MANEAEVRFLASRKARYESVRESRKQSESQIFWSSIKSLLHDWSIRLESLLESPNDTESDKRQLHLSCFELENELKHLRKVCLSSDPIGTFVDSNTQPSQVNGATLILPSSGLTAGDMRKLYNDFAAHQKKFDEVKRRVLPQGKFVFRRYRELRAKQQQASNDSEPPMESPSNDFKSSPDGPQYASEVPELSKLRNSTVVLQEDGALLISQRCENDFQHHETTRISYQASTIILQDIENCDIELRGNYSAIYISTVAHTKIKASRAITGAMHLTNCHHCYFQCDAQQLRIHDSSTLEIRSIVAGGAILEESRDVIFYSSASLDVRDFNWLRNTPSPNFTIQITKTTTSDVVTDDAIQVPSTEASPNGAEQSDGSGTRSAPLETQQKGDASIEGGGGEEDDDDEL